MLVRVSFSRGLATGLISAETQRWRGLPPDLRQLPTQACDRAKEKPCEFIELQGLSFVELEPAANRKRIPGGRPLHRFAYLFVC